MFQTILTNICHECQPYPVPTISHTNQNAHWYLIKTATMEITRGQNMSGRKLIIVLCVSLGPNSLGSWHRETGSSIWSRGITLEVVSHYNKRFMNLRSQVYLFIQSVSYQSFQNPGKYWIQHRSNISHEWLFLTQLEPLGVSEMNLQYMSRANWAHQSFKQAQNDTKLQSFPLIIPRWLKTNTQ